MSNYKKDLEEFTYIISHDLNAPLRHIREFGKLLFKKLGDKVNDEEREYMQYMQDSVDKTEHMIASLLEYSRLDTQREDATEISVQRAVEETLELMSETIANAKAIVHYDNIPQNIHVDKNQFRQLFFKLISNAIKFCKDGDPPIIEISAQNVDNHWQFCISDNGIGLDSAQHERMFAMFKRLDVSMDGIGSGLTISRKIVEGHGGKIWIESTLGQGAKVFFTIPQA